MSKTIVMPIDESNASLKMIPYAVELASLYNDNILLLNIQPTLKELGLATITKVSSVLQESGIPFSAKIRVGIPAMEIVAESHNKNVRYIVMAIGKGREEAIGSVSKHVLKLASCPVLLIPEHI